MLCWSNEDEVVIIATILWVRQCIQISSLGNRYTQVSVGSSLHCPLYLVSQIFQDFNKA
jgi:hypothetical protein